MPTWVGSSVWLIPPSKGSGKNREKSTRAFEKMDRELSDYESLNEAEVLTRC
jgi:hypothetical protein